MNQFKEGDSMEDLKPRYCIENDFAGQRELADREKSRKCTHCNEQAAALLSLQERYNAQEKKLKEIKDCLETVIAQTISHVDGRDLLAELHPRKTLDIKRRVDGVETWFEGDWLSNLHRAVILARQALAHMAKE